jgi:beta-propeller repeat-containing protein
MRKMVLFRKSILFACLLFTAAIGFTQVTEKWVKRLNGDANAGDHANALVIDRKGNVIVTDFSSGNGTGADYATVKYDDDGDEKWVQRYNGPGNGLDVAQAIAADHKGNVCVTGASAGIIAGEREIATIKYDDDGNTKWVQRFKGTGPGTGQGNAIASDKKGNVYITGFSAGDIITIKYDKNGDTMWVRTYNGPGNGGDAANAIAVDNDGNVYVTGLSTGNGTGEDITTIKYDDDGDLKWVQRL